MCSRSTWKWIGVGVLCACLVVACCCIAPAHGLQLVQVVRVWTHGLAELLPTAAEDEANVRDRERLRQLREVVLRKEEENAAAAEHAEEEEASFDHLHDGTPILATCPSSPLPPVGPRKDNAVAEADQSPLAPTTSGAVVIQRRASVASSREIEVRAVLERLLRVPFPKARPSFLIHPASGRALELDCFAPELRLAVEVSGEQHFVWPNSFHRTRAEFDGPGGQLERDALKRALCEKIGITLLVVPFSVRRGAGIEAYVRQLLAEHRPELLQQPRNNV